jgi:5'-AMP-activated protein kinase, regulatory gamma subunit
LPVSFRLILLDTNLLVKKALNCLIQNSTSPLPPPPSPERCVLTIGIVSAPLWNTETSTFAGLLTASDFINVIKYYYQKASYPEAIDQIAKLKLHGLRDVEKEIGASPPETLSINPQRSLYDACQKMLTSRARRIPLIEADMLTGREIVVSVMTQYRILKFIAVNMKRWTNMLKKKLCEIRLGTYEGLATASMESTIFDVISLMSDKGVASIPIVDENGTPMSEES